MKRMVASRRAQTCSERRSLSRCLVRVEWADRWRSHVHAARAVDTFGLGVYVLGLNHGKYFRQLESGARARRRTRRRRVGEDLRRTRGSVMGASAGRPSRRFFVAISGAILAIVLLGFGPTLYLRAAFDVSPISPLLYLHGALMTGWFALVVVQATLIRGGRVATHRRLGIVGVCVGVGVVVAGTIVTLGIADRVMRAPTESDVALSALMGLGTETPLRGLAATALWGNLSSLTVFSVLVGWAALMRNRGDVHKRLMLFASLCILPPAIARISAMARARRRLGTARARRPVAPARRNRRSRPLHAAARALGDVERCRFAHPEPRSRRRVGRLRPRDVGSAPVGRTFASRARVPRGASPLLRALSGRMRFDEREHVAAPDDHRGRAPLVTAMDERARAARASARHLRA